MKGKSIDEIVTALSEVKSDNMDIYDVAAVLISDIHDVLKAKDKETFYNQKADLKQTALQLDKLINGLKFQ